MCKFCIAASTLGTQFFLNGSDLLTFQDQFKAITNKYYRIGKAFIFVFALDDQNSLEYLKTNFEDLLRERVS